MAEKTDSSACSFLPAPRHDTGVSQILQHCDKVSDSNGQVNGGRVSLGPQFQRFQSMKAQFCRAEHLA